MEEQLELCMKLKKPQLQYLSYQNGLPVSGNKSDLCVNLLLNGIEVFPSNIPDYQPGMYKRDSPKSSNPSSPPASPRKGSRVTSPKEKTNKMISSKVVRPSPKINDQCLSRSMTDIRSELSNYGSTKGAFGVTKQQLCDLLAEERAIAKAREGQLQLAQMVRKGPIQELKKPKIFTLSECETMNVKQLKERIDEINSQLPSNQQLKKTGLKFDICKRLADYYQTLLSDVKTISGIVIIPEGSDIVRKPRVIPVTGKMRRFIAMGGQEFEQTRGRRCIGNSYVYGTLLDISDYEKIYTLPVSSNRVSIVDYDQYIRNSEIVELAILEFTNPQKIEIYAHYDRSGEIDSLVVENSCLFID